MTVEVKPNARWTADIALINSTCQIFVGLLFRISFRITKLPKPTEPTFKTQKKSNYSLCLLPFPRSIFFFVFFFNLRHLKLQKFQPSPFFMASDSGCDFKSHLASEIFSFSARTVSCAHRHFSRPFFDWYRLLGVWFPCSSDFMDFCLFVCSLIGFDRSKKMLESILFVGDILSLVGFPFSFSFHCDSV